MQEIKRLMPVKGIKGALAMPELEVTGMDERWGGGSTTRNRPREKKKKEIYACTIPLNTEGPSLSRELWTAENTIHGVMSHGGGRGEEKKHEL